MQQQRASERAVDRSTGSVLRCAATSCGGVCKGASPRRPHTPDTTWAAPTRRLGFASRTACLRRSPPLRLAVCPLPLSPQAPPVPSSAQSCSHLTCMVQAQLMASGPNGRGLGGLVGSAPEGSCTLRPQSVAWSWRKPGEAGHGGAEVTVSTPGRTGVAATGAC